MPLKIVRNDITHMQVDAIVNSTNAFLLATGGADLAIRRAGGRELDKACRQIGRIAPGKAAVTKGYSLPCRYVIHTVGPLWSDEDRAREILASCYQESLYLAVQQGCRSVAIPLIGSGTLGFPKDQALFIAVEEIRKHPFYKVLDISLVVYDERAFAISEALYHDVQSFIDSTYIEPQTARRSIPMQMDEAFMPPPCAAPEPSAREPQSAPRREAARQEESTFEDVFRQEAPMPAPLQASRGRSRKPGLFSLADLNRQMAQLDESFSQMLLRKIDESGMTDSECYKKAGIDRRLFSKIRSDENYRPSKPTVISFAIALELPLDETRDMLEKAGFALSHSSKFDVIVEYFIRSQVYDLFQINEVLYSFDQSLLGV